MAQDVDDGVFKQLFEIIDRPPPGLDPGRLDGLVRHFPMAVEDRGSPGDHPFHLVDRAGWASVFWINVPIGLVAILVSWIVVPESSDPTTRALDLPGTALATGGLFSFVWGLIDTSSHDWGSADVLVRLGLGTALLIAFFAWEARTAEPMLPLGFFRSLRFSAANAVMLALGFALLGTIYFLTLFMQNVQGYSAVEAGVRSLPLTTMIVVVAPLSGRFSARFGPRQNENMCPRRQCGYPNRRDHRLHRGSRWPGCRETNGCRPDQRKDCLLQ